MKDREQCISRSRYCRFIGTGTFDNQYKFQIYSIFFSMLVNIYLLVDKEVESAWLVLNDH